jgi:DNA-binding NarL/FixJ family response regulator
VCAELEDATFKAAWAAGHAMPLEQAVAYALATVATEDGVRAVAQDHKRAQPVPPRRTPAGAHSLELTVREREVLRLVSAGMTDAQVAGQLSISRRTVNTHLASIYNKLDVNSRTAAVRVAKDQHLL